MTFTPDFTPPRALPLVARVERGLERVPGCNLVAAHNVVVARALAGDRSGIGGPEQRRAPGDVGVLQDRLGGGAEVEAAQLLEAGEQGLGHVGARVVDGENSAPPAAAAAPPLPRGRSELARPG